MKSCVREDEKNSRVYEIFEMNTRVSILETESLKTSEEPDTSQGGKQKFSSFAIELKERSEASASKLVVSLETKSQLGRDLSQIKEKFKKFLKSTNSSQIL